MTAGCGDLSPMMCRRAITVIYSNDVGVEGLSKVRDKVDLWPKKVWCNQEMNVTLLIFVSGLSQKVPRVVKLETCQFLRPSTYFIVLT